MLQSHLARVPLGGTSSGSAAHLTDTMWHLQLLKERASGMYKLSAFYFARTSSDMPLDLVIPTIFILIVYFMSGLRTDGAKYFFENYFSVILVRIGFEN